MTIVICKRVGPTQNLGIAPVVRDSDVLVDALTWGTKWVNPRGGALVIPISIYSPTGDSAGAYVPNAAEIAAFKSVLETYNHYINVTFTFDQSGSAGVQGIRFVVGKNGAVGTLGFTQPPGQTNFNGVPYSDIIIYRDNYLSDKNSPVNVGGADFATYLHELGHGLGLAHPHDHGGANGSPSSIFPGVTMTTGSLGFFDLNQGINTIMGYNDGWVKGPLGPPPSPDYGVQATPMALDILTLQKLYGPNLSYHLGDDTYALSTSHGGYSCIWDAGGHDTLAGAATLSNVIDLRAATGLVATGGGGFVSYVQGIYGGYTIAAGVIIETAMGGNLGDVITGNATDNYITGGGGADILTGGAGQDSFIYNSVSDSNSSAFDTVTDFTDGVDRFDFSLIDANVTALGDQAFTFLGEASGFSAAAQIRVVYSGSDTLVYATINSDPAPEFCLKLLGHHVLSSSDFIL